MHTSCSKQDDVTIDGGLTRSAARSARRGRSCRRCDLPVKEFHHLHASRGSDRGRRLTWGLKKRRAIVPHARGWRCFEHNIHAETRCNHFPAGEHRQCSARQERLKIRRRIEREVQTRSDELCARHAHLWTRWGMLIAFLTRRRFSRLPGRASHCARRRRDCG